MNPAIALIEKIEKISTATKRMPDVSLETKTLSNKNFMEYDSNPNIEPSIDMKINAINRRPKCSLTYKVQNHLKRGFLSSSIFILIILSGNFEPMRIFSKITVPLCHLFSMVTFLYPIQKVNPVFFESMPIFHKHKV